MRLSFRFRTLDSSYGAVRVRRLRSGVLDVRADSPQGRAFGLGYGHGHDRVRQMAILRVVGRGESAQRLAGTTTMIQQDRFIRQRGFHRRARQDLRELQGEPLSITQAYCQGVNLRWSKGPKPAVFGLLGLELEPWTPEDVMLTLRLMAYLGLAQTQELVERFIIQAVRDGTEHDIEVLKAVYWPHLDRMDTALLRGDARHPPVRLEKAPLELDPATASFLPAFSASNAWALSGMRSASGGALLANDPHTESQTLPTAFYEANLSGRDAWSAGITVPGVPGVLSGRFTHVAVGTVYGFMDQVDFFVEQCKDGRCLREGRWRRLRRIPQEIRVKGKRARIRFDVWESELGVIEGDPLEEGRYLCRAYIGDRGGLTQAITIPWALEKALDLNEAMPILATMPLGFTYVAADDRGRVGLQQAGLAPRRPPHWSGLHPVAGWDSGNHWAGHVPSERLYRKAGPGVDSVATANDVLNPVRGPLVVNTAFAPYRVARIKALLRQVDDATPEDMKRIQGDLMSLRARRYLGALKHLLPEGRDGDLLREWDGHFDPNSRTPTLFRRMRAECLLVAFGPLFERASRQPLEVDSEIREGLDMPHDRSVLWEESNVHLAQERGYDDLLLDGESVLWQGRDRDKELRRAIHRALDRPASKYKRAHRLRRTWLLLDGSPAEDLGIASRWYSLPGSASTPQQGRIMRTAGRTMAVSPIWRMVADLSSKSIRTALAGGPSDRWGSRWYCNDLERFIEFNYKEFGPRTDRR